MKKRLAKGGLISGAVCAALPVVGYVLPESVVSEILSVSPSITITGGTSSDIDVRTVAEEVAAAIKKGLISAIGEAI